MTQYRLVAVEYRQVADPGQVICSECGREKPNADVVTRRYRQGDVIDVTGAEETRLLAAGALAPLDATEHQAGGDSEAGGHPVAPEPHGATPRPPKAGSHAAWVDYAVSRGVDRELAESMTKAELIAEYASE